LSNYGCATNSNLAAMIADPEDLVRGKTGGPQVDAALSGKAIKAYREAQPTGVKGLKVEETGGN
jgi:pilus assembly protein CpaD